MSKTWQLALLRKAVNDGTKKESVVDEEEVVNLTMAG